MPKPQPESPSSRLKPIRRPSVNTALQSAAEAPLNHLPGYTRRRNVCETGQTPKL